MSQLCVLRPGGHGEECLGGALSKPSLPPTLGDQSLNSTVENQHTVFMFLLQFSVLSREGRSGELGLGPETQPLW